MNFNDWLKRNKMYVTLIVMLLITLSWIVLREMKVDRDNGKIAGLQAEIVGIQIDRDGYKVIAEKLQHELDSITKIKDDAEIELIVKKEQLFWLQKKHKKEIDSLLNKEVPVDTVYVRLGYMYPNYDNGVQLYPFSGTQVRQVYAVGINYPRLKSEYDLQSKVVTDCFLLTDKYKVSENNLNSQINNLNNDIKAANTQIGLQSQVITTQKSVIKRKTFWNICLEIVAGSGWIYAAFK